MPIVLGVKSSTVQAINPDTANDKRLRLQTHNLDKGTLGGTEERANERTRCEVTARLTFPLPPGMRAIRASERSGEYDERGRFIPLPLLLLLVLRSSEGGHSRRRRSQSFLSTLVSSRRASLSPINLVPDDGKTTDGRTRAGHLFSLPAGLLREGVCYRWRVRYTTRVKRVLYAGRERGRDRD